MVTIGGGHVDAMRCAVLAAGRVPIASHLEVEAGIGLNGGVRVAGGRDGARVSVHARVRLCARRERERRVGGVARRETRW